MDEGLAFAELWRRMNPLFQRFSRYARERAMQEFRASSTGKIVREIEQLSRSKGAASSAKLDRLTRELLKAAKSGDLERMARGSKTGRTAADIQRYAAGGWKEAALESMFQALGPLGDLFRSFLRPRRAPLAGIDREIQAAANLLKVFRPDLLKQPGRKTLPPDPDEARKVLEDLGFTVTPPGKKPRYPKEFEYVKTEAGERVKMRVRGEAPYRHDDPIMTGEMIQVSSSNVYAIGFIYDQDAPEQSVLKVRFWQQRRGSSRVPGPMYFYYRVPPQVFQSFRAAASKGKFVWDRLRVRGSVAGHQYQYELKGIAQDYVPRKATRYGPSEYFIGRRVKVRSVQGMPMGYRESELPDQFVQPYSPTRGTKPARGSKGLGPKGPTGPRGPRGPGR
jgi:hypothetical protein